MNVKSLMLLCEGADPESDVLLRVLDDRKIVKATASVDDNGLLCIEEKIKKGG